MKQKSQNRFLAALLAVAMMLQMLPMLAFADDAPGTGNAHAVMNKRTGTYYESLQDAVIAAESDDTITLGEGVYSLGDTHKVTTKSLTFVGKGPDKTTWQIQAPQAPYGADGYCDYSFDGSDSITFQDMTVTGSVYPDGIIKAEDTQGYVRVQNITLKDCVFNGRADYWGYTSTTFDNVTFNAPGTTESGISSTNYSLWTYTGKTYTFKDCTFNSKGKTINVYRHTDPGYDVTVNFENCTVNSNFSPFAFFSKTALNINDSKMGGDKFIINITNPTVTAARDTTTCSQVFGFGGKESTNNKGKTEVYWNGSTEPVWKEGKMQTHSYTDGEHDQAISTSYSEWTKIAERLDKRKVTEKCAYCSWLLGTHEEQASVYRLQYNLNGGAGDGTADYRDVFTHEKEWVTLAAAPTREGYHFDKWQTANGDLYDAGDKLVLTGDEEFTAQWKKNEPVNTLTVTGGTFAVKKDDIDVTDTLKTSTDDSGKQTCLVPYGAEVTVTLDKTKVPEGMVFDIWSTGKFDLPLGQDYKAESITFTMKSDVDVAAQYRSADIDDGPDIVGPVIAGTAVVAGGAVLGYQAYALGTELMGKMWGLPYFPSNRSALAMMLWEDAGKPMPESEILYPDVGQEERDMDLQHAARWAMEHDLLTDLNDPDTELPPEQVKFYPDNMITKINVLRAWKKAQDLKQNAQ